MIVEITLLTLKVAVVATLVNFPVALYLGWLLGRKNIKGTLFLEVLVTLPLALPPVVIGYGLLLAFG
ncbi:MAG: molybdate ABC transporter permease subunit, partial [Chloroflexota bacterium]|nr:molybdate ABC transporter permease subunit [Chloroflexota bacterium]